MQCMTICGEIIVHGHLPWSYLAALPPTMSYTHEDLNMDRYIAIQVSNTDLATTAAFDSSSSSVLTQSSPLQCVRSTAQFAYPANLRLL